MKLVGALMLIAATTCIGINKFLLLKRRISYLEQMTAFVERISTQMRYLSAPVDEIIDSMRERNELPELFNELSRSPNSFADSVLEADESVYQRLGLTKADKEQLRRFACELGTSDIEGQTANCKLLKTQLEYELSIVRRDLETKGKMYLTLGIISGLMVALLLT